MRVLSTAKAINEKPAGDEAPPAAITQPSAQPRPVFVYDSALAATVRALVLPSHIELRELSLATSNFQDNLAECGVQVSGAGGGILLGFLLPPPRAGQDDQQEQLRNLLPDSLREEGIFTVTPRSGPAAVDWCWRRLCRLNEFLLREYARGQIALAGYREREAQLERSLAYAEAAFIDFRKEPLKLALRLEPSGVYLRPAAGAPDGQITVSQTINTLFSNIVYIDVFFSRDGAALQGEARFTARAAWSGAVICDTAFAVSTIRQGWKRFFCQAENPVAREPVQIELSLNPAEPASVLPGLSSPSPLPEDCAHQDGAGSTGRPLALQIWSGIAGLRYPRHFNAVPAAGNTAPPLEITSVPVDFLLTASPFLVSRQDLDFVPVSYESETQSLLVHPLGLSPTAAKLPSLHVKNLKSVTALVQLRRLDAQATDFAILALPASDRAPRADKREFEDRITWLHLKGGEWGDLRYELSETLSGEVDLFLLTRNRTDDYNFSWAFFRGLQLESEA
jgi:hypothetical protein